MNLTNNILSLILSYYISDEIKLTEGLNLIVIILKGKSDINTVTKHSNEYYLMHHYIVVQYSR